MVPYHCTKEGLFRYLNVGIIKLYLNVASVLVLSLLLQNFPEPTLMLQCISWVLTYNLNEKTLVVWFDFCLSSLANCVYWALPSSLLTSVENCCGSEACHSSEHNACGIRVTFSPHCGIVGEYNIDPLPGSDEEEQAESADRWRGDPWWECTTAPAVQLEHACCCCWRYNWDWEWIDWGWSSACGEGWGWHGKLPWSCLWQASDWGMAKGIGTGLDGVMKRSAPPVVPEGCFFTWSTTWAY